MSMSIMTHTVGKENFEIEVKTSFSSTRGAYPVITIEYGGGYDREDITIFPSFEQIKQIQAAINSYVEELEAVEVESSCQSKSK